MSTPPATTPATTPATMPTPTATTTGTAGVTGVRRQDMAGPLDDSGPSLNATQQRGPRFAGPDDIRADIAATREELVVTLDTLLTRLDVPARLRERAGTVANRASDRVNTLARRYPAAVAGAIAGAVAVVAALRTVRSRRRPARLRLRLR